MSGTQMKYIKINFALNPKIGLDSLNENKPQIEKLFNYDVQQIKELYEITLIKLKYYRALTMHALIKMIEKDATAESLKLTPHQTQIFNDIKTQIEGYSSIVMAAYFCFYANKVHNKLLAFIGSQSTCKTLLFPEMIYNHIRNNTQLISIAEALLDDQRLDNLTNIFIESKHSAQLPKFAFDPELDAISECFLDTAQIDQSLESLV